MYNWPQPPQTCWKITQQKPDPCTELLPIPPLQASQSGARPHGSKLNQSSFIRQQLRSCLSLLLGFDKSEGKLSLRLGGMSPRAAIRAQNCLYSPPPHLPTPGSSACTCCSQRL